MTSTDWRCLPYYVAPLDDPAAWPQIVTAQAVRFLRPVWEKILRLVRPYFGRFPQTGQPQLQRQHLAAGNALHRCAGRSQDGLHRQCSALSGSRFHLVENLFTDNLVMCRKTVTP